MTNVELRISGVRAFVTETESEVVLWVDGEIVYPVDTRKKRVCDTK
jgi:hypothetical protein